MSYIKGNFKRYIYEGDNGYTVGLFKIKETSPDLEITNETVTFTGYFNELNELDLYKLNGEFITHQKYGTQFQTDSYEIIMPEEKDHIIDFLSSELFKGIGEKKAEKIVEVLGNNCLNEILENKDALNKVRTLTQKQKEIIYISLENYRASYEEIMKLIKIGFSMKESLKIQKTYKQKTYEVLNNPYQMIKIIPEITFNKIEKLRSKLEIDKNDINRISAGIIYVMEELCFRTGNTYLSYEEIIRYSKNVLKTEESEIEKGITNLIKEDKILIDEEKIYQKEMYESEEYIAERLIYLTKEENKINFKDSIKEVEDEFNCTFNEEQKQAIENALKNKISVITGGPGTGKTTIIKGITRIYQRLNKLDQTKLASEVALLAPTGRASKRMASISQVPSYTIHRFLKWQKEENTFLINEENKSNARLVIIDEASMLDTNLFYNLLLGLKENTSIVLIGDYNQLPSVGSGQVLKDIIESDTIPVTYLKKLYRQEECSNINLFAHDIINNKVDFNIFNESDDLTFIECQKEDLKDNIKDFVITYKDMSMYEFQVLAPLYKGENGIDDLNNYIQKILNKKTISKEEIVYQNVTYREEDKVLHLVNSVENNVFNGDIGEIIKITKGKTKEMYIDFDNNLVKYTPSNFENFKLGYTISIHKAQGSEFSIVILPVVSSYNIMLYKKLIYTAVTRAKKRLIIIGEKSALIKAIATNREDNRKTSLKKFLIDSITF